MKQSGKKQALRRRPVLLILLAAMTLGPASAEIIEEIAARVNDSIIVRSEVQKRRGALARQISEQVPPEERDEILAQAQEGVLFDMIIEELLLQQARLNFDMEKYFDNLRKDFMRKNEITTSAELDILLRNEELTTGEFRRLLLRSNVPQDVLQFEVARQLTVTPEEIQAYYAENPDRFRQPGEVLLREIVILAEPQGTEAAAAQAQDALARVAAGEPFEQVARELSAAPSRENGGSVGPFKTGDLAAVLEEEAFSLPVGGVSEPMETSYGFHIITVVARTEPAVAPLAEVEEQVERTLRQQKYTADLDRFLSKLWADNQVVVNQRYATGKLADGGPYATREEILAGDNPLGPQPENPDQGATGQPPATPPAADTPAPESAATTPAAETASPDESPER